MTGPRPPTSCPLSFFLSFHVSHSPARPLALPSRAHRLRGYTSTYMRIGSPTPSISGMTHLRSNAFASTILNIFCTLIDADVEQKMTDACIAFAKRFACATTSA